MDNLDTTTQLAVLGTKIDAQTKLMETINASLDGRLDDHNTRLDSHEARITSVERFQAVEKGRLNLLIGFATFLGGCVTFLADHIGKIISALR